MKNGGTGTLCQPIPEETSGSYDYSQSQVDEQSIVGVDATAANLEALANDISQIETGGEQRPQIQQQNELDPSSLILNRIKLWPPAEASEQISTGDDNKVSEWYENAYPFKSEEFGQLFLPDNVIKAKLVSLNSYGAAVSAPFSNNQRSRHVATESQTSGNFYLFTVEENDYLNIYKIKSYLSAPLSNVITNFKMAKKASILLEYSAN